MIVKEYDKYKLVCDNCLIEVEEDNFYDCIEYSNNNDWTRKNEDGEWLNYCEECSSCWG